MKKSIYYAAAVAVTMFVATSAMAQQPGAAASAPTAPVKAVREASQQAREAVKEKVQATREAARTEVKKEVTAVREGAKEMREGLKKEAGDKREALREEVKAAGEKARGMVKEKREALKDEIEKEREAVKGKIEANRKALKVKLKTIKDESKRGVVETLSGKFDALNAERVRHFGEALDKLGLVLGRINDRAAKAKTGGKDVAAVETAAAAAQKAIDDARTAVTAQAGKVYKVTVTTEAKLKDDLKKVRDLYQADIKAVEEKVKAAREAVHTVATTLAGIPGIEELKEASAPVPATQPSTSNTNP